MYSVLSLFPDLLIYSFFAPTVLRLAISTILIHDGVREFRMNTDWTGKKSIAAIEVIAALFLLFGFYTQAAAIVLGIFAISNFLKGGTSIAEKSLYGLMVAVLFSLLITGPGAFAIDLPL